MKGPVDEGLDLRIPDSWELVDLDDSMTRLRVSSTVSTPPPVIVEAAAAAAVAPAYGRPSVSSSAASRVSGDVAGQVDEFLREALEKPRERLSILRMEQDIENFIHDPAQQQLELKPLPNSYLRLAAYRIAEHYCLQSTAVPDISSPDGPGSRIVLRKTSECHSLPIRLADIPVNLHQEDSNNIVKVAIKQRPQKPSQTINSGNSASSKINHSKSVEERKEEYNRARARIFSSNSSSSNMGKSDSETPSPDSFQQSSVVSVHAEDKYVGEGPEINVAMNFGYSSGSNNRSNKGRQEKEPVVSRHRANCRVAIFRDREMDRTDPDYDRNYERYMQRFDPGFGFNGGTYGIQPLYTPAVNYNTEFPQLGSSDRPQFSVEHQHQSTPRQLHGPWGTASVPTTVGYGPPEGLMGPFNTNHLYAHSTSSIYMLPSQYIAPPSSGTGRIHPHEHGQSFAQAYQQQPESSSGSARPR